MIYLFRKEIKKWHSVLWVVFASLALGGLSSLVFRYQNPRDIEVISIDGMPVSLALFDQEMNNVKSYLDSLRSYARMQNLPEEMFLGLIGLNDPKKMALDNCIQHKLFEKVLKPLHVKIDTSILNAALYKQLPAYLLNQDGTVNMIAYKNYLAQKRMSISEFEAGQNEEIKRSLLEELIDNACYVPFVVAQETYLAHHAPCKFTFAKLPFSYFVDMAKKSTVSTADLEAYYEKNKENYRISEKKSADFWVVNSEEYADKVAVDESTIERYYERNKGTLFRISPKVKVRRIQIAKEKALAEGENAGLSYAQTIRDQVVQNPQSFVDVVKKVSIHKDAAKGGLVDYFEKGTYDPEFEKAAFRLQNVGDISPLIITEDGYEILQLADRLPASAKPLDSVRNEIIKTIKGRKGLRTLESDMKVLVRTAKHNESVLEDFVKQHRLTKETLDAVSRDTTHPTELRNAVLKDMFASDKKEGYINVIAFQNDYVLYRIKEVTKSYVPSFKALENKVIQKDYYNHHARQMRDRISGQARKDFFAGASLADALKECNVSLKTTDFITPNILKETDEGAKAALRRSFILNSDKQLMVHQEGDDLYFVTFVERKETTVDASLAKKDEVNKQKKTFTQGFIASLRRGAKIEINDKIFAMNVDQESL